MIVTVPVAVKVIAAMGGRARILGGTAPGYPERAPLPGPGGPERGLSRQDGRTSEPGRPPAAGTSVATSRQVRTLVRWRRDSSSIGASSIGLDIGSSAVKAVQLKETAGGYALGIWDSEPVPRGAIVDSTVLDPAAVAAAVRRVLRHEGCAGLPVAVSVSGSAAVVRRVSLPPMTAEELEEAVRWEASYQIPIPLQDVALDYQVLRREGPSSARDAMDVLLVAARRERIAGYLAVVERAGLGAVVVDVDAFAVQNTFVLNYDPAPGRCVALVNAGASLTTVSLLMGSRMLATRDLPLGGNACTEALQHELGLTFEMAEGLEAGRAVDGASREDVTDVLEAATERLMQEVAATIDAFRAVESVETVDEVFMSGGASRLPGFARSLEARLQAPVAMLDPFRVIARAGRGDSDEDPGHPSTAAVAVGLALRRAGDR